MVTVVGPTGIGKSRLARAGLDDEALVVDLVRESSALSAITRALALRPQSRDEAIGRLAAALGGRQLLLDNAEQHLDELAELIPQLGAKVLVTSRETLRIDGEQVL